MAPSSDKIGEIIEIPAEQLAERNGAFVVIYSRTMQPYLHYDRPIDCPKDQKFAHVLMQLRWDGVFGFPGGKVDQGETLRQACARESMEEIGVEIDEDKLVHVCSHMERGGTFAAHLYAFEVTPEGLQDAIRKSWTALDAEAEVCGVVAPRISTYGADRGKGITHFVMKTPMSFSARHELLLVLERLQLLGTDEMKQLREAISTDSAKGINA